MARPPHQPLPALRRQVEAMAGFGVPETDLTASKTDLPDELAVRQRSASSLKLGLTPEGERLQRHTRGCPSNTSPEGGRQ